MDHYRLPVLSLTVLASIFLRCLFQLAGRDLTNGVRALFDYWCFTISAATLLSHVFFGHVKLRPLTIYGLGRGVPVQGVLFDGGVHTS